MAYTIRNLDEKTKETVQEYAQKHNLNIAEAMRELVLLGVQHMQHTKNKNKHSSFFDIYDRIKFKGGKNLSKEHDQVAYEL
jgi:hypothetical protein